MYNRIVAKTLHKKTESQAFGEIWQAKSETVRGREGIHERGFKATPHSEVVGRRMNFSSDASANSEDLLDVNQEICTLQMAEKASPDVPPICAGLP